MKKTFKMLLPLFIGVSMLLSCEHGENELIINEGDYYDEYGINHGQGIEISGVTWAPVNCGFHAADYKYGKYYQWGRKIGHGYFSTDLNLCDKQLCENDIAVEPTPAKPGEPVNNPDDKVFYKSMSGLYFDWYAVKSDEMLKSWTYFNDKIQDPCPEGWRVPTLKEYDILRMNYSKAEEIKGIRGTWFSGETEYSESLKDKIFLPFSGSRANDGKCYDRNKFGLYWASSVSLATCADYLIIGEAGNDVNVNNRSYGFNVRCVRAY